MPSTEGVAFCAAVMGTDLRHTPVVGGEVGYVDFSIKPDLNTLRSVPWNPQVAWCLGEAWTLDGSAPPRNVTRYATFNGEVSWSHTGGRVAFVSQRRGAPQMYVLPLQKPAAGVPGP